ncbi:hypothetical protein K470DRAFT_261924 [Piedraia hortae CBS 480.64]|uniref:Uncharacterized protein n=1 Tax=Piedraia hortae CBS 480.64 TaxID=1314780 RepID=A0A6A7C969_9PEZI|nr:hypothetical protein K470DRAFT_261924 [Piedraia hortae CBS 480.64]
MPHINVPKLPNKRSERLFYHELLKHHEPTLRKLLEHNIPNPTPELLQTYAKDYSATIYSLLVGFEPTHPMVVETKHTLAFIYAYLGRLNDAANLLRAVLEVMMEELLLDDVVVLDIKQHMATYVWFLDNKSRWVVEELDYVYGNYAAHYADTSIQVLEAAHALANAVASANWTTGAESYAGSAADDNSKGEAAKAAGAAKRSYVKAATAGVRKGDSFAGKEADATVAASNGDTKGDPSTSKNPHKGDTTTAPTADLPTDPLPLNLSPLPPAATTSLPSAATSDAKKNFTTSLTGLLAIYGNKHPYTLRVTIDYAIFCASHGLAHIALQLAKRALEAAEEQYGPNHILVCDASFAIGRALVISGDLKGAEVWFNKARGFGEGGALISERLHLGGETEGEDKGAEGPGDKGRRKKAEREGDDKDLFFESSEDETVKVKKKKKPKVKFSKQGGVVERKAYVRPK